MLQISTEEVGDLQRCVGALQMVLARLDKIGAGIAAIHVDAAIDQLTNNIEIVSATRSKPSERGGMTSRQTALSPSSALLN